MNTIDIKMTYPELTITYQIDLIKLSANVISNIGDKVFLSSVEYCELPEKVKDMVEALVEKDSTDRC